MKSSKNSFCLISRFGHGWVAGEGFDFVREALDIGFGGTFGLFRFGGRKGSRTQVLHDGEGNAAWGNENATCDFC